MNVYEKLLKARVMLQSSKIKKSGKNNHLKFEYMELDDFLPTLNKINEELKLFTMFSISESIATCTVLNAEKPEEQIVFQTPTAEATLKGGGSKIQELGSMHTYLRRYLYLMVYEITESDALDAQVGQNNNPTIDANMVKTLEKVAGDKLESVLGYYKVKSSNQLTTQQFKQAMERLSK